MSGSWFADWLAELSWPWTRSRPRDRFDPATPPPPAAAPASLAYALMSLPWATYNALQPGLERRRAGMMPRQHSPRNVSRRRFLAATLRAGGAGLALGDILRLRARAAGQGAAPPDTSVIQIWLGGGPSQFETFDPKPGAPTEIRGPYSPIQSKLPGALVSEKFPLT